MFVRDRMKSHYLQIRRKKSIIKKSSKLNEKHNWTEERWRGIPGNCYTQESSAKNAGEEGNRGSTLGKNAI